MSYQPPYIQGPAPQQPPPPKKSHKNLILAIIIGVAIVLVAMIASCAALFASITEIGTTPTSSPSVVTSRPVPSPTFASPAEPSPTPKPTPTVNKADADFRAWVTDFLPHTTELQTLIADLQADANDEDIEAVEKDARKLIKIADEMRDNQPPKSGKYKRLHKEYNSMVDDFKRAGVLIRDGAKGSGDYYLITEGGAKLEAAGKHAEKVGDEIEKVS